mmetsp:Transcript_2832/g.4839  ORF Transcript_2832/g.4839 Transcript_2832/m.4839 type:complete len:125 (-) Transcript_2832:1595-1969(-)
MANRPPQGQNPNRDHYGNLQSSLEKAAMAAKVLDNSDNAKEALGLAMKKEETRQLELQESKVAKEIQKTQIQEEERRKTVQYEQEMAKRRAEYQVQLELQRDQQKMAQKEKMSEESRQRDEESV